MALINQDNPHSNWFEALALWNRIANWLHYGTSEEELKQQLKSLLIYLWNEKDWLKAEFPEHRPLIEAKINASAYMSVVGELANTLKHRRLDNHRAEASDTNFAGSIGIAGGGARKLYFIELADGKHVEIMNILRGALDEFEALRFNIIKASAENGQGTK